MYGMTKPLFGNRTTECGFIMSVLVCGGMTKALRLGGMDEMTAITTDKEYCQRIILEFCKMGVA